MDALAFNRTVTVRSNYIEAGGTDKSRFAEEDAILDCDRADSVAYLDPALLAEFLELLECTESDD